MTDSRAHKEYTDVVRKQSHLAQLGIAASTQVMLGE